MKISKGQLVKRIVIISLCAVVVIFCVVSFFCVKSIFSEMFSRADIPEYTAYLRYDDVKENYDRETVSFNSGENTLTGYIYGTDENTKGLVVISHGLGGYSESYLSETLYFVDNGYTVLAYDNTGSGNSEGKGTMGMGQSVIDLDSALDFVESNEKLKNLPVLLYGHSWGGYAVTAILNSNHDITASVSVAGYNTPMGIIFEQAKQMMPAAFATIEYPFMWLNNKLLFGEYSDIAAVDSINSSDTDVMIIHGTGDKTIQYDGAAIIAQKEKITNPNVKYKIMDGELNGHNNLFISEESNEYIKELNKETEKLADKYNDDVPDDVIKEFYDSVDKELVSELSADFMDDVNNFYLESLGAAE